MCLLAQRRNLSALSLLNRIPSEYRDATQQRTRQGSEGFYTRTDADICHSSLVYFVPFSSPIHSMWCRSSRTIRMCHSSSPSRYASPPCAFIACDAHGIVVASTNTILLAAQRCAGDIAVFPRVCVCVCVCMSCLVVSMIPWISHVWRDASRVVSATRANSDTHRRHVVCSGCECLLSV